MTAVTFPLCPPHLAFAICRWRWQNDVHEIKYSVRLFLYIIFRFTNNLLGFTCRPKSFARSCNLRISSNLEGPLLGMLDAIVTFQDVSDLEPTHRQH